MTLLSGFLWLVLILLQLWLLIRLVRYRIRMPFLELYLAFCSIRTVWLVYEAIWGTKASYRAAYWPLQAVGYEFQILLAISLVWSWWSWRLNLLTIPVMILPWLTALTSQTWDSLLRAAQWCDIAAVAILAGMLLKPAWRPLQCWIAKGIVAGMLGHLLVAILQNGDPQWYIRLGYQLAGLSQLLIWSWALTRGRSHSALSI